MSDGMAVRIAALQRMTTGELREQWRRLMGEEPRSYNRQWLFKRLAWQLQARELGGLSERAQKRLEELLPFAPQWLPMPRSFNPGVPENLPATDRRLPAPGTVLTRPYKGKTLAVTVLEGGAFEFEGKRYDSLTAIATAVTGSHWNGRHFFGVKSARKTG